MERPAVLHRHSAAGARGGTTPLALLPLLTATRPYACPTRASLVTALRHRPAVLHAHDLAVAAEVAWWSRRLGLPWAATVAASDLAGWLNQVDLARQASLLVTDDRGVASQLSALGHAERVLRLPASTVQRPPITAEWLAGEPGALAADLDEQYVAIAKSGRSAHVRLRPAALPTMTVVMVTGDRRPQLRDALGSLLGQDYPAALTQLVVVDNASSDGSAADLAAVDSTRLHVLTRSSRVPAYVARNEALAVATGEIVAFTDDDCYPEPGWLAALAAGFRSGVGVVQGRTEPRPGTRITPLVRTLWTPAEYGLYETANMAYRRELLGPGFDEEFGARLAAAVGPGLARIPFGEDTELAWRLKRRGAASRFASTALVRHQVWPADVRFQMRRAVLGGLGFPALVREVPELRGAFLWRRVFVSRRHAEIWLAAVGLMASRRRPIAGTAVVPYLLGTLRPGRPGRRDRLRTLAPLVVRDAVEVAATVVGAVRSRTLVM